MKRNTIAFLFLAFFVFFTAQNNTSAEPFDEEHSSGIATVLLLPAVGGSNDENLTLGRLIANLRDINMACNLIDESQNTALLPAGFNGFAPEDRELLYRLGCQYKAHSIIYAKIQRFGNRNLAIVSRYSVYSKVTSSSYYVEYSDPIEAWIKLPVAISAVARTLMVSSKEIETLRRNTGLFGFSIEENLLKASTEGAQQVYFQVKYGNGVDRVFADRMISLFAGDFSVVEVERPKHHSFATGISIDFGKTLVDRTADYEAGKRDHEGISYSPRLTIETSRQGNKTRFRLLRLDGKDGREITSVDFTDERDFIRQMRGLSLTLSSMDGMSFDTAAFKRTAGYDLGIEQGVKYNYWKYAGEDSSILDMITYVKKFPPPGNISVPERNIESTRVNLPLSWSRLGNFNTVYYSTEKDFSKAQPVNVKINYGSIISNWIENLQPDTQYYFWVTRKPGYLTWLESDPSAPIEVRTKGKDSTPSAATPASQYRSRYE